MSETSVYTDQGTMYDDLDFRCNLPHSEAKTIKACILLYLFVNFLKCFLKNKKMESVGLESNNTSRIKQNEQ